MIRYNDLVVLPKDNYGGTYDKKKNYHNDVIISFDIETTSGWIDDNNVVVPWTKEKDVLVNKKGKRGVWYRNHTPVALCYLWQCAIDDVVFYGRELVEFISLLDRIDGNYKGIKYIYVHNLPFEFGFLRNILKFESVFARSKRKPIKCNPCGYNVEFRCSYSLTRLSLEAWGKQIGYEKKVGYLDYNKIRTPLTPLEKKELEYGETDVLVMQKGLDIYKNKYKHIKDIPLTQTGEVRQVVRKLYKNDFNHLYNCTKNLPANYDEYKEFVDRLRGGETHANYRYAGDVIKNVTSKDINSSYPWIMCTHAFPTGKWYEGDYKPNDKHYAYMLEIELYGVSSNMYCHYISYSKCEDYDDVEKDNGKIMSAKYLKLKVLDFDFEIIKRNYKIDKIVIKKCLKCRKRYLPISFVRYVLELYCNKTKLKNVEGMEEIYLQSKQFVNSLYGMMITALVQDDIKFNNELGWDKETLTKEQVNEKLAELKEKYYKNFTQYDWGIYVVGYARKRLWDVIFEMDKDVVYYDTDSVKYVGNYDWLFNMINKIAEEEAEAICKRREIPKALFFPCGVDGECYPLGHWSDDGEYTEFKTLGAKRYCYRSKKDGKLHLTVSGVNKKRGVLDLNNDINSFKEGMVFSAENSGKLLLTELTDMPVVVYPDGYMSNYKYGINMRNTSYKLTLSDDYSDLISDEVEELMEIVENKPLAKILGD